MVCWLGMVGRGANLGELNIVKILKENKVIKRSRLVFKKDNLEFTSRHDKACEQEKII